MIFEKPTPFAEALNSVKARVLLPTDLSSTELGTMDAALHERSLALARVTNTTFLQGVSDVTEQIISGKLTRDAGRRQLKALVDEMGEEGLLNSARLNLIIRMQVESAFGYGQWRQSQSPSVLQTWPAQEFYRAEWRKEPRNWPQRWEEAGGTFFPGGGSYPQGRMIAMKDSPIWEEISRFGTPYAPFDFNSGMDIRGIKRSDAIALGLMKPDAPTPQPQQRDFEKDFGSELSDLTPELKDALLESLGEDYKFDDDVLTYANCAPVMLIMAFAANANPTAAQIRAGNYRMKHLKVNGLNISIENPAGSARSGTDAKGNAWRSILPADYGYIKRTEGADGDAVDCFVGNVPSPLVHVVDQQDPWTMKFDEHKCFINFKDADDARKNYLLAFGDGSGGARIKNFVTMGFDEFKDWLKTAKTKKPASLRNEVANEWRSTPAIPSSGGGSGWHSGFGPDGELIEGHVGHLPITTQQRGLIEKVSSRTKLALTTAIEKPEIKLALEQAGIRNIQIAPTSNKWTMAHSDGALMIHPRTAEVIEKSQIPERRAGGIERVIHHEAGHGLWNKGSEAQRQEFRDAVVAHPEMRGQIGKIVALKSVQEQFNEDKERDVKEIHAEVHAMKHYAPGTYAALPEKIRKASDSFRSVESKKMPEHLSGGRWVTMHGRHVYIRHGESPEQALARQ